MLELSLMKKMGSNLDIINTLGKWKILECHDLHKHLSIRMSYHTLKHKVRELEKAGIIESKYYNNKLKHVFLTDKGIQFTNFDKTYQSSPEELPHDILTAKIVQELLTYKKVVGATMYHRLDDCEINPDAVVQILNDKEYNLALEIELTRKSQRRIKEKFEKYGESERYDYCIYITNKRGVFVGYQNYLLEMSNRVQEKLFLIFDEGLSNEKCKFSKSEVFYDKEIVSIEGLFGDKTKSTYGDASDTNVLRPNQIHESLSLLTNTQV